jgi:hypothetical protein
MIIDLTAPEGNTLSALGIATRMLKAVDAPKEEIDALCKAVFAAKSPEEARAAITDATNGAITFHDPREDD